MTTGPTSQCFACQRLRSPFSDQTPPAVNDEPWCEAFPEGIPPKVYSNEVDHREPVDGDHGLRWLAREGMSYPRTFFVQNQVMTAAAEPATGAPFARYSGAMVALVPTADWARASAADESDGGLPVEELHVTLAYLGDQPLDDGVRAAVLDAMEKLAGERGALDAEVFAVSLFNPTGDEPCITLGLSGDDLAAAYLETQNWLHMAGADLSMSKQPWHAHLTLAYTDDHYGAADYVDRTGPITFDRLRVAFGGEVTDFPLGG